MDLPMVTDFILSGLVAGMLAGAIVRIVRRG